MLNSTSMKTDSNNVCAPEIIPCDSTPRGYQNILFIGLLNKGINTSEQD